MDLSNTKMAVPTLDRVLIANGQKHWPFQFFPPTAIEWNEYQLSIARWPVGLDNLRILHLSDFHLRRTWSPVLDLMLDRINENPPDLLLFTGDFVDNKRTYRPALPQVRRLISRFTARFGCYGICGNHDNYKIERELVDSPITLLDGKRQLLNLPGGQIEIIGLPGHHRLDLRHRFVAAIPPVSEKIPRIVLSHFPDHLPLTGGLDATLFLAGHTHGGQICFTGGTPLLWHDSLPRQFACGAHLVGKTWLVVSRGVGYTGIPLRLFCAPEVAEIRCKFVMQDTGS